MKSGSEVLTSYELRATMPRGGVTMRFWWGFAAVSAFLSAISMIWLEFTAENAIQQCAGAAMAMGGCVVPYVLARTFDGYREAGDRLFAQRQENADRAARGV